jgi:hypothetical protein
MRLSRKILLNTGGLGSVRNMISTEKEDKRTGIWDTRALKSSSSVETKNEIDNKKQ